jgi:hypothetical protein
MWQARRVSFTTPANQVDHSRNLEGTIVIGHFEEESLTDFAHFWNAGAQIPSAPGSANGCARVGRAADSVTYKNGAARRWNGLSGDADRVRDDPVFFQRQREWTRWLLEFAVDSADRVFAKRPDARGRLLM